MVSVKKNTNISPDIDQSNGQAKILINWSKFELLCAWMTPKNEIANFFGCSESTLSRRIKEYYNGLTFEDVFTKFSSVGRIALRKMQFEKALLGDTRLLVFLGKNMLGQRDAKELSGSDGGALKFELVDIIKTANKQDEGAEDEQ